MMKIELLKNYGGSLTGEQRILPGVYDSEDVALFGLADYLVENGHAIVVGAENAEVEIRIEVTKAMADGVWADDTTITTQSDTFSGGVPDEGVPVEPIVMEVKVAQEDIDALEEARAEYEKETLAEKQADLAEMLADDPSLSSENFQEDDPDEILEKVEEDVPEAKPKRGRPKKQ